MDRIRYTGLVLYVLGSCAVPVLVHRASASAYGGEFDLERSNAKGDYLLAASLSQEDLDYAQNASAADESQGARESTPASEDASTPQPGQPDFRASAPPYTSNPESTGGLDNLPQLEPPPSPPPPSPAQTPEKPEEPAVPEEEQNAKPVSTGPPKFWENAPADSPVFGTEDVTQFSDQLLSHGKWGVRPHFSLGTVYDGNIFIQNNDQQSGMIALLSAGATLMVGSSQSPLSLILDYTATGEIFFQQSSENTIDQAASLDFRWTLKKLALDFRAAISAGTGTSIDIGNRVTRYGYSFGVGGNYELTAKTSINMNLTENLSDYGGYIGSSTTRLDGFFNYQFRPKLTLGLGGGIGYMSVQDGGDQVAEVLAVRAVYAATEKVTINANYGFEFREYSSGIASTFTPVFGISGNWVARQGTQLTLSASRSIFNSASLNGQDYIATGISLGVHQRLTDRCNLSLDVGYQNLEYQANEQNVSAQRADNYFLIRPGLELHMTSYCALGIYYEYSQDVSNDSTYGFQRDRLGLQVNLRF